MPTNAASKATAPRMRSASATSVASASGSCGVVIEPPLQDHARCDLVARRAALAPGARGVELRLCELGRVALVRGAYGDRETFAELAREVAGARGDRVRRAVGGQGKAHAR